MQSILGVPIVIRINSNHNLGDISGREISEVTVGLSIFHEGILVCREVDNC